MDKEITIVWMNEGLRELYVILGTNFCMLTGWLAFSPVFPLHVDDLGFSYFHLGILVAIPFLFSIFLRLPIGIVASRIGREPIILSALAIQSLSFLFLGFLSDWGSLFTVRILQGVAISFFPPIIVAAIYDLAIPTTRGRMFGLLFTSAGFAMISGPLLSTLLLQFLNLNTFFLVLSLFPAVGFGIYLISSPDRDQSSVEKYNSVKSSVGRVLKNRGVLALCSCRVLFEITASMFATVFPVYTRDVLLITPSLVSALFMIRGMSNTFMRLPSGKLSDRIGRKKPILIAYLLLVGVFYLSSETKSLTVFMLIMALYGFAWGLRIAPETALISDLVDSEDSGVGIAINSTMIPLGSTIGSILAGWLALTASIQTLFKLSSLMIVPAVIILLRMKER